MPLSRDGRRGKHKFSRDTRGDRARMESGVSRSVEFSRAWQPCRSAGRILSERGKREVCCRSRTFVARERVDQTALAVGKKGCRKFICGGLGTLRFCLAFPAGILISPRRHAY